MDDGSRGRHGNQDYRGEVEGFEETGTGEEEVGERGRAGSTRCGMMQVGRAIISLHERILVFI